MVGLIGVVAVTTVLPSTPPVLAAGPIVGVASSMDVLRPDGPIPSLPASGSLTAVRNETESFQLLVSGPATDVAVTGDLFGWGTTMLYREGAYDATKESDHEGGIGRWWDALIPDVDIVYHEKRNAFPFSVAAGKAQAVWVDVFVPATVAAGRYSGALTVSSSTGTTMVPVSLEVIDWTMPSTSSVRSAFYSVFDQGTSALCKAHFPNDVGKNCNASATTLRTLHSLYSRMALDDRVTIANGAGLNAAQSPADGDPAGQWETLYESPIIRGDTTVPPGASWRLPGAHSTTVSQHAYNDYDCNVTCAAEWKAEATEVGQDFSNAFLWYACDEAGGSSARWSSCATYFNPVAQAWPAKALVTAPIQQYEQFGQAHLQAQVLVVISQYMDGKVNPGHQDYGYLGNQRSKYDAFLQTPGNEVWLYSACDGYSCDGQYSDDPVYDGWPGYAIDAPAVQSRAESWMDYKYDVTGDLYWAVDQRLATAWDAGGSYYAGGNGDGTLFYPGRPAIIGGTTDIPVESIRLKRIRDGREDYEYLKHLTDLGYGGQARAIVDTLFPTMHDALASKDGTGAGSLLGARDQLVQLLRQAVGPTAGTLAFASNRDGDFELFTMKPDGTDQRQLTSNSVTDRFPAWSPDGSRIAWTQGADIVVADPDGTDAVNVTADIDDPAEKPVWTRDGQSIVFVRSVAGHFHLWQMSAVGADKVQLVAPPAGATDVYDPAIAADGHLVYSARSAGRVDLVASEASGANPHPAASVNGPGLVNEVADVAVVSGTIAFSQTSGTNYDVMAVSPDGANVTLLSTQSGHATDNEFDAAWSLDNAGLAYVADNGGDTEIWRVDALGRSPVQLTANTAADLDPDWGVVYVPVTPPPVTEPPASQPDPPAREFVGLVPGRIMDTRADGTTVDGTSAGVGAVAADSVTELLVAGRAGVAADATAAVLNVTVTEPVGDGYATVFPCGSPRPTASNLNYTDGQTVPNAVVARLGVAGRVCVYSQRATHLVVDVNGYFPTRSRYRPINPSRLLDTRVDHSTVDGSFAGLGAVAADHVLELDVAGRGGIGADAAAVVLNLTAVDSSGPGYATVYPCGSDRPTASNLNFSSTATVPNGVISKIGLGGRVCIYVSATTELVVDANGDFSSDTDLAPLVPARLLDTRPGEITVDGQAIGAGVLARETDLVLGVAGRGGVPASARSVVLNVTVTEPAGAGFLTVFACDAARPTASSLNFVPHQTVANLVLAQLAGDGTLCFFSNSDTHLVVDVVGYYL